MIALTLAPLALMLAPLAPPAAAQDASRAPGYAVSAKFPRLHVEGEPWRVTVTVTSTAEEPAEVPLWAFSAAALELDGQPVADRPAGALSLVPGQQLETSFDAAAQVAGDRAPRVLVRHALVTGEPIEVQRLRRAEKGIDFMELPVEQLGDYQVVMRTNAGDLWLELWPDVAPRHVRNFLDLSYTGFYDGSNFHRVIPGFMVQGGRSATGQPAPRSVDAEFSTRRHVPGVLSAARLGNDENSATSEFFVMHMAAPSLDGKYSAFGMLKEGSDAVDRIVESVSANLALASQLARVVPINLNSPMVGPIVNNPNPPQSILKAIVVKTPRAR